MTGKWPVTIYTDGGCSPNPGCGGWAALLQYGKHEKLFSGSYECTTNNRMELRAAIEGLSLLKRVDYATVLYTDSKYVSNAINLRWIESWKRQGWQRGKKSLKNKDLWQELDEQLQRFEDLRIQWVKGHAGIAGNERVDQALTLARLHKRNCRQDMFYLSQIAQGLE